MYVNARYTQWRSDNQRRYTEAEVYAKKREFRSHWDEVVSKDKRARETYEKKVGITTPASRELRKTLQMVSTQGSARGCSSVIGFETGVVLHLSSGG